MLLFLALTALCVQAQKPAEPQKKEVRKALFIGDSMTGWLSERLAAYGAENGFDVSTVVWDGSTIKKWGDAKQLASTVKAQKPDVVFVSLGMNELFEPNPQARLKTSLTKIKDAIGDTPIIWVGPPSWPGHNKGATLDSWLKSELGKDSYFSSLDLNLPRQSAKNPHPTKAGMIKWMDEVIDWIPENASVKFPSLKAPAGAQMVRGKNFIYKRMKESF